MNNNFEKLKKGIPSEFHFLLNNRLCDTDTMTDRFRIEQMNRAEFNKCERCGYDLFTAKAYTKTKGLLYSHPHNGYVNYYHRYRLILCDKCVDELNGHPWR